MNILRAMGEHIEADLAEAEADAADLLARYVAAQQLVMELQALRDLRKAMGVIVQLPDAAHSLALSVSSLRAAGDR